MTAPGTPSRPAICVVGRSNAGKTLLMEGLITALKARGHRVAAIKHTPHGHQIDLQGKDSQRMFNAGADAVVMGAPNQATIIRRVGTELELEDLLKSLGNDYDVVLVEGYKQPPVPKIVVLPQGEEPPGDADLSIVLATVVPTPDSDGVPRVSPDVVDNLVTLIEQATAAGSVAPTTAGGSRES